MGKTTKAPELAWHLYSRGTDYEHFSADSRLAKSWESKLWVPMYRLMKQPVLDDPVRRADLIKALSICVEISPMRADEQPSIPLAELADGYAFHVFTSARDDVIDDVLGVSRDRP